MSFIAMQIKNIDDTFFGKSKKITAKEVFYHNMLSTLGGVGIHGSNMTFAIKTRNNVSPQALEKASNKISCVFKTFAYSCISKFFSGHKRILAVDGTVISINKCINLRQDFDTTNTGSYCKGYLTVIYDVMERIPIAARLDPVCRERAALMDLSDHINPGDILILDRNYYSGGSEGLFNFFDSKGIKLLCRLSNANKTIMKMKGDDIIFTHDSVTARKITFVLPQKKESGEETLQTYTFVTNLSKECYPVEHIKHTYHQRWDIEEFFKTLKTRLGGDFYNHHSIETIHRKIFSQLLVTIFTAFIIKVVHQHRLEHPTKPAKHRKWEQKISIGYTLEAVPDILYELLYRTEPTKNLFELVSIVAHKATLPVRPNRSFARKTIRPPSMFYSTKHDRYKCVTLQKNTLPNTLKKTSTAIVQCSLSTDHILENCYFAQQLTETHQNDILQKS